MRSVVNETAPPGDEYCFSSAAVSAAERGWPLTGSPSGPPVTSERPSWPSKVHSPTAAVGGNDLILSCSAPITLASRDFPPSSVGIDWSSRMVAASPLDGANMASASVARFASSPTDRGPGSAAKLVTGLLGGLIPFTRNPALANRASCSGFCMKRANPLAAELCSCVTQEPLSCTAGESATGTGPGGRQDAS